MLGNLGELNFNMIMYIAIIAFLLCLAISVRIKNGIIFKFAIRFVFAVGVIYGMNYISEYSGVDIGIPFNPVTTSVIAFLQVPGIALIYITKFVIYPM